MFKDDDNVGNRIAYEGIKAIAVNLPSTSLHTLDLSCTIFKWSVFASLYLSANDTGLLCVKVMSQYLPESNIQTLVMMSTQAPGMML